MNKFLWSPCLYIFQRLLQGQTITFDILLWFLVFTLRLISLYTYLSHKRVILYSEKLNCWLLKRPSNHGAKRKARNCCCSSDPKTGKISQLIIVSALCVSVWSDAALRLFVRYQFNDFAESNVFWSRKVAWIILKWQ